MEKTTAQDGRLFGAQGRNKTSLYLASAGRFRHHRKGADARAARRAHWHASLPPLRAATEPKANILFASSRCSMKGYTMVVLTATYYPSRADRGGRSATLHT